MLFTILKIIQPLFLPPTLIFLALILGFWFMRKGRRWGRIIMLTTIVVYYVFSIEPTAYFFERTLTRQVSPATVEKMQDVQAIVVLGGGAHTEEGYHPELGGVSWKRFWHGVEIYRALGKTVSLFYVGGSGDPFNQISKEAELARQYAVMIGIPEEQFWIETSSRDTYENGVAVKRILDERFRDLSLHRVVLVTSAVHMPRALKVFGKADIETLPAPADFGTQSLALDPLSFVPSASAFSSVVSSLHEWLGIAGYHLRGRI